MIATINKNSDINAWRLFTTNFTIYSKTVDYSDYVKFCSLIEQIFKNLFHLDINVANNIPFERFKCYDDLWEDYNKSENEKSFIKVDTLCEIEPYNLKISFIFNTIDNFSIFERCELAVINNELLEKLPQGNLVKEYAYCSCFFDDNMCYKSSKVKYLTTVNTPRKYQLHYKFNYVNLLYTYFTENGKTSFELEYLYEDGGSSYSKDSSKYFLMKLPDISVHTQLKLCQLRKVLTFYSDDVDLSDFYPDVNPASVHNAIKLYDIIYNFILSSSDEASNILLLEMSKI